MVDEIRIFGDRSQIVERKTRKNYSAQGVSIIKSKECSITEWWKGLGYQITLTIWPMEYKNMKISKKFAKKVGIHNQSIFSLSNELSEKIKEIPEVSSEIVIVYEKQHTKEIIGEVGYRMNDAWLDKVIIFARTYWTGEREAIEGEKWKYRYCEVSHLFD